MHSDIAQVSAGVMMRDVRFFSAALEREMPYRAFLPEAIEPGRRFPVVYLLHGHKMDFHDWSINLDLPKYASQGLILVTPEGHSSFYVNAARIRRDKYEDYVAHDLVKDVESRFPALSGRAHRAIMGISMGGFGALVMALRHPEMYAIACGLSSALDVPERRFSPKSALQWWKLRAIFGPMGSTERAKRDPFHLAKMVPPNAVPPLYLTAGENEFQLKFNRRFVALLAERGIAHEFHIGRGGHDWNEWAAQIPGCFERMMKRLGVSET